MLETAGVTGLSNAYLEMVSSPRICLGFNPQNKKKCLGALFLTNQLLITTIKYIYIGNGLHAQNLESIAVIQHSWRQTWGKVQPAEWPSQRAKWLSLEVQAWRHRGTCNLTVGAHSFPSSIGFFENSHFPNWVTSF